ncbi:MAG: hypothetical protein ACK44W_02155 [Planctomycetota bacterium]
MNESVLGRDRALVLAGLAVVALLAWAYLFVGPAATPGMSHGQSPAAAAEAHAPVGAPAMEEAQEDESLPP